MPKLIYYYELNKVDGTEEKNVDWLDKIKEMFNKNKGRYDVKESS